MEIEDVTVRYENGLHSADNLFCREKSLKEYRIKDVDIHEFLHFIMEDGGKLPADFPSMSAVADARHAEETATVQ